MNNSSKCIHENIDGMTYNKDKNGYNRSCNGIIWTHTYC